MKLSDMLSDWDEDEQEADERIRGLMAMAQGLVAVSGGEPEYYELIGERHNRPVVNVDPTVPGDIDARLEWLVRNKRQLPAMSRAGRDFVEKHNAAPVVAQRYLDFWAKIASMKG